MLGEAVEASDRLPNSSARYVFSGDFGRIWGGKSLFSDFSKKRLVLKQLGFSNGS